MRLKKKMMRWAWCWRDRAEEKSLSTRTRGSLSLSLSMSCGWLQIDSHSWILFQTLACACERGRERERERERERGRERRGRERQRELHGNSCRNTKWSLLAHYPSFVPFPSVSLTQLISPYSHIFLHLEWSCTGYKHFEYKIKFPCCLHLFEKTASDFEPLVAAANGRG